MHPRPSQWALALLALAAVMGSPARARACGGFFCNQPQTPGDLPVAQTAENVLFAMSRAGDRYQLEAHVQIAYTGPADRFSWVVPVDSMPALDVGSDQVFARLIQATEPQFDVTWKEEGTCRMIPEPDHGRPTLDEGKAAPGASPPRSAPTMGSAGVDVSFRGDVGPYDAAVIRSTDPGDPKPLLDWLAANKYFVSPEGSKLIADYVREDKFFVAIRLVNGADTKQIQPLVMRFQGPGPCIPLRLTAIAALSDLQINLWVLGEHRVVPDNYFELELNEAALAWLPGMGGRDYDTLIKSAANEAGGNAFVTDYSGPAAIMRGRLYSDGQFQLELVASAPTPPDALDRIYNQLRRYWTESMAQFAPFDAAALAAALDKKFVAPMRSAQELFDRFPTLTRLRTFISPEEMSLDPTFVMNPVLPQVPVQRTAKAFLMCGNEQFTRCDAPVRLELPSGGALWLKPLAPTSDCGSYPASFESGELAALPALQIGWKRDDSGLGVARFDNQARIQEALARHNAAVKAYADGGCDCHLGGRGSFSGRVLAPLLLLPLLLRRVRRRRRDT
jgi:hypothetical protein